MKRRSLIFFIAIFIFVLYGSPCISSAQEVVASPVNIISPKDCMEIPGTTPYREDIVSLLEITPEEISVSNQVFQNISKFAPDAYLLTDAGISVANPWGEMTSAEIDWVRNKSSEILGSKKSTSDKIRAVAEYVAKNVGYDYDYYYHAAKEYKDLNHTAYDVLTKGFAVCYGYSAAVCGLLQSADIPCLMIDSPNHAWNMAYDGTRWILLDSTWMSRGKYEYGVLTTNNKMNNEWYDFSVDVITSDYNHLLECADYTEYDNAVYKYPVHSKTLTDIILPSNITKIGKYIFATSTLPKTLDLKNVEIIEECAFYNCPNLTKIENSSNIKSIGDSAFSGCSRMSGTLDLKNADTIGSYAFSNCANLTKIENSSNIETIKDSAFSGCNRMSGTLDLKNVNTVGAYAFFKCENLEAILLGSKITSLPYAAFYSCSSVTDFAITGKITSMDDFAISHLTSLKRMYIADTSSNWQNITGACYNYMAKNISYVYNYVPKVSLSRSVSSPNTIYAAYIGVPTGEQALLCEYKDGQFLGFSHKALAKDLTFTLKNTNADSVMLMVINDFGAFRPQCNYNSLEFQ